MTSTTATNLAGMWFGELASALQGRCQVVAAGCHCDQPRHRQRELGGERKEKAAAGAGRRKAEEDVGRCSGTMSDVMVCLLLDRFAPS
uniref:Uncharacterized protein n=1 Tax=Arundo donax TaxID=35708 RepID=A0A0A8XXH0_ARUDO